MNKAQEDYLFAKAWADSLKLTMDEMEQEYIRDKGITNSNNTVPKHIYLWNADDESVDKAAEEFYSDSDVKQLGDLSNEADELLRKAENALIGFGISLAPENIREALRKATKHWKYRKQILVDIALLVDVSTIPEEIRRATE